MLLLRPPPRKKLVLVHLRGFPPWPSNLLKPEVRSKLRMQEIAAAEELARSMKALGEPMTYLMFALAEPVRGKDNPSTQECDAAGVAAGVAAASVGLMEEEHRFKLPNRERSMEGAMVE